MTDEAPDRAASIAQSKHLTETALPALAHEHRWPVRFDHCFKRICLDYAFEGVWYKHVQKPAELHLHGEPLARAVECAKEFLAQGLPLLRERNLASLRFRGKLPPIKKIYQ